MKIALSRVFISFEVFRLTLTNITIIECVEFSDQVITGYPRTQTTK